ncbi:MAG: hypothetical protein WCX46_03070 [Candidatus Paceibacterota bacterium]
MKKIIILILVILVVIGIFWFAPIVPYQYQVYCIMAPCPPQTEMMTLSKFISLEVEQRAEKARREYISPEQLIQIRSLMEKNGKSSDGLKAYKFQTDEAGMTHVRFYIYKNGTVIGETIYHFKADGTISSIS